MCRNDTLSNRAGEKVRKVGNSPSRKELDTYIRGYS